MATAIPTEWEVVPGAADDPETDLQAVARRCRKKVTKSALFAAGVAMVPLPGIDWLTDVGVLVRLLPQINAEFGLTPEQIERLAPDRRIVVYKAISAGGGLLVGRIVTRDLVLRLISMVGVRLTHAAGCQVRALGGAGGVGGTDLHGAEIRLRSAHPAMHGGGAAVAEVAAAAASLSRAPAATMTGSGCSAAW